MTKLPIRQRTAEIEEALAHALATDDFEIVHIDGEPHLRPVLIGHVHPEAIWTRPLLSLAKAAREIERRLS